MFHSSVATYARCGGTFNNLDTANLLANQPVKEFEYLLRFDRDITMSMLSPFLWNTVFSRFCGSPYIDIGGSDGMGKE